MNKHQGLNTPLLPARYTVTARITKSELLLLHTLLEAEGSFEAKDIILNLPLKEWASTPDFE
jgi:hypothetical protein